MSDYIDSLNKRKKRKIRPRIRVKDKPAWKTKEQKLKEKNAGPQERARNLGLHPKSYVDVMFRLLDWRVGMVKGKRWVLKLGVIITSNFISEKMRERIFKLFSSFFLNRLVSKSKTFVHRPDLEFFWTILPTLILILLAVPSLHLMYILDIYLVDINPMLTVKVIGNQWFWTYEYCVALDYLQTEFFTFTFDSYMLHVEDLNFFDFRLLTTDNPLVVPLNIPVRFIVTASDVLHSWAIPSLGIKLDACPGRLNQFFGLVERIGEFYGQCSEICGINHGFMPVELVSLK